MLRPGTFALTLLLSFLTALGPLSMDMYLPSLPDIGRTLAAPTLDVQLTISSYLFGFAAAQIFYGPVSDRLGRRPVLLAALVLYALATIGWGLPNALHQGLRDRVPAALPESKAGGPCGRIRWD